MKNAFAILFLIFLNSSFVAAQLPESYRPKSQAVGNERMREMFKQRIKDEAKLNEAQTDSVLQIQQNYQLTSREIEKNEALKEDEKKSKLNEIYQERNKKIKGIVTEEQFKKIDLFYENLKKMKEQIQGQNTGT